MTASESVPVPRASPPSITASDQFLLPAKNYNHQYASIYYNRLMELRPTVKATIRAYDSSLTCHDRMLDVRPGERCAIIGTLYKHQPLKPSILAEYAAQKKGMMPASITATSTVEASLQCEDSTGTTGRWTSDGDSVVMEDDAGRIKLVTDDTHALITGAVAGVIGRADDHGRFIVEKLLPAGLAPQPPLSPSMTGSGARYVLAVSGLMFGSQSLPTLPLSRSLLLDYVTGFLGSLPDTAITGRIDSVIIAGNSLHRVGKLRSKDGMKEEIDVDGIIEPSRQLDMYLSSLAQSVPVVIVPGATDPVNFTFPQQPIHSCITPLTTRSGARYQSLTNPALFSRAVADERHALSVSVTGGQNVNDVLQLTRDLTACDVLEAMVRWRHTCPTCPDTLPAYPFTMTDPFILRETPHLVIAGNQASWETRLVTSNDGAVQCRLVSLPSFATSQCAALIDVSQPSMPVQTIHFTVDR